MLVSFEGLEKAENTEFVCDLCPRSLECRNLKSALCILEQETCDSNLEQEVEGLVRFKEALANFGYSYPKSYTYCELAGNKEAMHLMVDGALKLLKRFRFAKKIQAA